MPKRQHVVVAVGYAGSVRVLGPMSEERADRVAAELDFVYPGFLVQTRPLWEPHEMGTAMETAMPR